MSAGDLLIRAVDRAMQHGMSCPLSDCPVCDAGFNQIRLAYKVWTNSRHQQAAAPAPQAVNPPQRAPIHYGSHGMAECGAHGDGRCDEATLTKDPALVTCRTCRGWLPLVANRKPASPPGALAPVTQVAKLRELAEHARHSGSFNMTAEAAELVLAALGSDLAKSKSVQTTTHSTLNADVQRLIDIRSRLNAQSYDESPDETRDERAIFDLHAADDIRWLLDRVGSDLAPAPQDK